MSGASLIARFAPDSGAVKDMSQPRCEFVLYEGFGNQLYARIESTVMHDGITRVSRGKQYFERGELRLRHLSELLTVHAAGQHDIGEQQINASSGSLREHLQRAGSISRLEHLVAEFANGFDGVATHIRIVFDDQNRFACGRRDGVAIISRMRHFNCTHQAREMHRDLRAKTWL